MADEPEVGARLEPLDPEACRRLLTTQPVGRIGITAHALPVILPVNYAVLGDAIVFRTIPGTKLDAATNKAIVAFEVDSYEPDGRAGWSVVVVGRASRLEGDQLDQAETLAIDAWPLDGQASNFVGVEIAQITGRRFQRRMPSAR